MKNEPFKQRIDQMISDGRHQYHIHLGINQSKRTAEQAQAFHICHMFLYNYFPHRTPKICSPGTRTIAWSHLSNPKITWALIDGLKPTFLGKDEAATRKGMAQYLHRHKVSSMAAPGLAGCGEPCNCGGHASKHLTGEAYDLHGLDTLGVKIQQAEPRRYRNSVDAVDGFLLKYQLCRPMAHLHGKARELWHVESLPRHVVQHPHPLHQLRNTHTHVHGCGGH
jgi:hypothetical protein